MKNTTTLICCIVLSILGFNIIKQTNNINDVYKQNTLHAATVPYTNVDGQLPIDILLNKAKHVIDNTVSKDTIFVRDTVKVTKIKYKRIPIASNTTDTVYINTDTVKNKKMGNVELFINNKKVYSTPTDTIVTDGLELS